MNANNILRACDLKKKHFIYAHRLVHYAHKPTRPLSIQSFICNVIKLCAFYFRSVSSALKSFWINLKRVLYSNLHTPMLAICTTGSEVKWRQCVSDTNNNLGFAVGAMFVREAFHEATKPLAQTMVENIRLAFQENLANLDWMDDETRQLAKEKAAAITDLIGYPEFIIDPVQLDHKYENLTVEETDYFGNNVRVSQYSMRKNLEKLDKPVNKTKWGMTPPTVNAYYTPTSNQMAIPAGILQAPFFHPDFPPAMNYGGIGVVIGHEATHAFDDSGK